MRTRFVLLVAAILLVAGFAAMNWSEVIRPAPLLFGTVVREAPLGAILLGLLALAVVVFVVTAASLRTRHLVESRQHYKELEAQRQLADKAEASRFHELRQYFDEHLRVMRNRDATFNTEWQRELRAQTEQSNRMLAARLNELEHRLEIRFERMGWGRGAATIPARSEPVPPAREPILREHATAEDVRDAQLRDEPGREEREQRREDKAAAAEKPESGWRRWF